MLEHGGNIPKAVAETGIPASRWIDVSTGINPHAYPCPQVPAAYWYQLPQAGDGLERAAADYYGASALPVPGTQSAIQALPRLRRPSVVAIASPTYAEHAAAWRAAGHQVHECATEEMADWIERVDVAVVCNPNNPDGYRHDPVQLSRWQGRLAQRGGWLVVDEAFADLTPELSLTRSADQAGLVVLRSLGKFFGLPGLRIGFVVADAEMRERLAEALGPWAVSGPARYVAREALWDFQWQRRTRELLEAEAERLTELLGRHGLEPAGGTALFQYIPRNDARQVQRSLAEQAVLARAFDAPAALRLGLPATEQAWSRLDTALGTVESIQRALTGTNSV